MGKFLKKLLPKHIVSRIKEVRHKCKLALLKMFSNCNFLASFYYVIISREFASENRTVLIGRYAYDCSQRDIKSTCALLRRNIHRLEKGITMRPRRDTFAADYIFETVDCYSRCLTDGAVNAYEMKWAYDVLCEYFEVVEYDRVESLNSSYAVFSALEIPKLPEGSDFKPYKYTELPECSISNDQLLRLFLRRRSVRWFQDKPVPENLLRKAINQASLAPSACNRQPYKFYTIFDRKVVEEVAKYAMGTAGFAHNIPCLIAVVGDLSAYPFERDRHVIYIDSSLVSMQLMLSLVTLGLSSCPINWPDIPSRDKKIRFRLKIKEHQNVVMLIAVGYADQHGMIPFSQKKSDKLLLEIVE